MENLCRLPYKKLLLEVAKRSKETCIPLSHALEKQLVSPCVVIIPCSGTRQSFNSFNRICPKYFTSGTDSATSRYELPGRALARDPRSCINSDYSSSSGSGHFASRFHSSASLGSFSPSSKTLAGNDTSASENFSSSGGNKPAFRKNILQIVRPLPNWGVGARVAKAYWKEGNFYEITEVKVYKKGKTGQAFGIFFSNGEPAVTTAKLIGGANKKCWKEVKQVQEG